MTIDSVMMPSAGSTQTITPSTTSSTDSMSGMGMFGMGTAGQIAQNMDSLKSKLYEDLKQSSSSPFEELINGILADLDGSPAPAPQPPTNEPLDATNPSGLVLSSDNRKVYDPATGVTTDLQTGASGVSGAYSTYHTKGDVGTTEYPPKG